MATSQGVIGGWHNTLNDGVYSSMSKAEASRHFLVQTFNQYGYRIFGAFRSSVDFYLYYRLLDIKEHHEVILGTSAQKPRFDIDLEEVKLPKGEVLFELGNRIRDAIIVACAKVLYKYKVIDHPNSILEKLSLYTSSTPSKYSLHIILDKYQHYNYKEALEFFKLVVAQSQHDGIYDLTVAVRLTILDPGIYKSSQNFRMLGSGKRVEKEVGKKMIPTIVRPKMYLTTIDIGGITHNFPQPKAGDEVDIMRLFRRSLITDVTTCVHIPIVVPIKPPITIHLDMPDGYEDAVMDAVNRVEPNTYTIRKSEGSLIDLQRDHPSTCCICRRQHEKISPYVTINRWGDILFHCRRAEDVHKTDTSVITRLIIGRVNDVRVKEEILGDVDDNDTDNEDDDVDSPPEENVVDNSATLINPPPLVPNLVSNDPVYLLAPGKPVVFNQKAYRKDAPSVETTIVNCIASQTSIPSVKPLSNPTIPIQKDKPVYVPKRKWDSHDHVSMIRGQLPNYSNDKVPESFRNVFK